MALDRARRWLTTCQNDHSDCSRILKGDKDTSASSESWIRMLEICEEKLRLIVTGLGGDLPSYVALSHCWGLCPTLKTLSTNIERFRIGIDRRDLPPTFEDAVKMAKSLGFNYIWIDSLCIIQDSPGDWQQQSSLMAFVYGSADLVLAASMASSTEDGFLKERRGYRDSTLQLTNIRGQGHSLNLRYRLLEWKEEAPIADPLDNRAWALQERLLARRYLAIGSHDMSWSCLTSSACECEWWRVASIWRYEVMNINKLVQHATAEQLGGLWRQNVLHHYWSRKLTFPSDNLVAISAIASIFQRKSKSKYFAGIWQDDLIFGMSWRSICPETCYASDDSAPSWSWASLPTLSIETMVASRNGGKGEAEVEVLETDTTVSTVNQFGSVSSGFLKLWGHLWRAGVMFWELPSNSALKCLQLKVKGYLENRFTLYFDTSLIVVETRLFGRVEERSLRRVRRQEANGKFYIGNVQENDRIDLLMVPLMKEYLRYPHTRTVQVGLILGRSPKDPMKFERIGVFETSDLAAIDQFQCHEGSMDDFDEQEMIII